MGFVELKCPNCGAKIQLDNTREFGFCSYCGTKLAQEKIIVEHRGKISVDGIAEKSALLERAYGFISEGRFEQANARFDRVLDIDPHCYDAYLGKLMCDVRARTKQDLTSSPIPLEAYPSYGKALKYANNKEKQFLSHANQIIIDRIKAKKRQSLHKKICALAALLAVVVIICIYNLIVRQNFSSKSSMIEYMAGDWYGVDSDGDFNYKIKRYITFDADGNVMYSNGKDILADNNVRYHPFWGSIKINNKKYVIMEDGTLERRNFMGSMQKYKK